ncbi:uncharacterized protein BXZ73DRAFT_44346, partial [Epithele typhae]|uniref:uncharacterized protein n=1 Tax=Epithele typhae TaxID=378194 RepID=UPI00200858E7
SGGLRYHFPLAYAQMHQTMHAIYERDDELEPNFPGVSVHPLCTVNMGPHTATVDHLDKMNYPGCPCAITALGDFDPDQGGHLYFRSPPGSTVILCSAALRHGNTAVDPQGKERHSFTQFTAGGLVRYKQVGFRLVKNVPVSQRGTTGQERQSQLARIPTPQSLSADRAEMFTQLS